MLELEKKANQLEKSLYKNNQEITDFNKIDVQKNLFSLIRECIKEKEYIVNVGSYELNINPSSLSVKYENDETVIEISNEDVYYETTRETEARFFVISDEEKDVYPSNSKVIKVTGLVTNIDGMCDEHYQFELFNDPESNIKDYLTLIEGAEYQAEDIATNNSVIIRKEIFVSSPRTDVIEFISNPNVKPVTYELYEDIYKKTDSKVYTPNNYSLLLPTLDTKKNNVSFLYNSIVDYYTEYISNN